MTWIDHNSVLVFACCVAGLVVLGIAWFQSGNPWLVRGAVLAGAIGVGALIVEKVVTTEEEAVVEVLHQAAAAVAGNDVEAALRFTHSQATEVRAQGCAEMPKYDFHEVSIKANTQVTIDQDADPPEAVVEFNARVVLSGQSGGLQNQPIPRFVIVTFKKEDGQWRVFDYEHHPPHYGMQRRPPK